MSIFPFSLFDNVEKCRFNQKVAGRYLQCWPPGAARGDRPVPVCPRGSRARLANSHTAGKGEHRDKMPNHGEKGDTPAELLHGKRFKTRIPMLKHRHFIKIKSALVTTLFTGESPKPKRTRVRRELVQLQRTRGSGEAAVGNIFLSLAGAALLRRVLNARQVNARLLLQPEGPVQREQPTKPGWQSLTPFLSNPKPLQCASAGAWRGCGGTAREPVPRERAKTDRSTNDSELVTLESGKFSGR